MIKKIVHTCSLPDESSKRIDNYLFSCFSDYSRSYFQSVIKNGGIVLNGKKVVKNSVLVKNNDNVVINFIEKKEVVATPENTIFDIVDIQKDFLIVNKPAGLVVHNTQANIDEPSLVKGLLYKFKEFDEFSDAVRPGIVHRLDKDTSGLMIVARTIPAQIALSSLFKQRKIHKTYLALVNGHSRDEGEIFYPIGRHPIQRHKMTHLCGLSPREAMTRYKTLCHYKKTSLIEAFPETGRTHQIRVHLAAIGLGIVGDTLYGYESKYIDRQALHAWKLSFFYGGVEFNYIVHVPKDFQILLRNIDKK
jgi:23S rRNA pseudouridine1911/1915/1917 synthase